MSSAIEKLEAAVASAGTRERQPFDLRLYIAGQTPRSIAAFANLKRLCEEHLAGCYRIEISLVPPILNRRPARADDESTQATAPAGRGAGR